MCVGRSESLQSNRGNHNNHNKAPQHCMQINRTVQVLWLLRKVPSPAPPHVAVKAEEKGVGWSWQEFIYLFIIYTENQYSLHLP